MIVFFEFLIIFHETNYLQNFVTLQSSNLIV